MNETIPADRSVYNQAVRIKVKRGIAWLDEIKPDWRSQIDLETLRLSRPDHCVLGQVFRDEAHEYNAENDDYMSGFDYAATNYGGHGLERQDSWAREHGFDSPDYETLDSVWRGFLAG